MIKECPVIMNNDDVTVVKFDGTDIQFPSVNNDGVKTLNVKFDNGKYSIVNEIEAKPERSVDENIDVAEPLETEKKTKKTIKQKYDTVVDE